MKINICEYICSSFQHMGTITKKQIFIALKFQTLKNVKFCSSEIKWVYSSRYEAVKMLESTSSKGASL